MGLTSRLRLRKHDYNVETNQAADLPLSWDASKTIVCAFHHRDRGWLSICCVGGFLSLLILGVKNPSFNLTQSRNGHKVETFESNAPSSLGNKTVKDDVSGLLQFAILG